MFLKIIHVLLRYTFSGCNVLTIDRQYHHCWKSHSVFNKVVREYKPNVLFVLSRYTDMFDVPETNTTSETENIVKEAASSLRKLSRTVTDHIFVLNAIPRPHFAFEYNHEHSLREHRPIELTELLNVTGLEVARRRVAESVATCSKCSIIDYTPTFTFNNTFHLFDAHSNVAYMNGMYHFTPLGLHRLRPFFKNICDHISSYSNRTVT
ncbi:hypothetical protein NECAME_14858 [Necator americanus]|uniref:SGNH domain-containing protein n=1 Tax=Necator americanus TaxID=51031 RepID=W2SLB6_NECAM|nr:hypothetical protein NECAME_14858 [Necator americanus]ETN70318.1 hypothetical protein NECAME_14858 [Necator americanus]